MSGEGRSLFLGRLRRWHEDEKWGFVRSDYQLEDFFVCVETDDSLEMRDEIEGLRRFRFTFKQ